LWALSARRLIRESVEEYFGRIQRSAARETGLDFFGARYMSSAQGRFTSPDPLLNAGRPDNPQTWNKYSYTPNNPLKYTDPTGLYEWERKCAADDAQCQGNRQQFRDALTTIRNAANQY
jgi:RHS repeat-associated protein